MFLRGQKLNNLFFRSFILWVVYSNEEIMRIQFDLGYRRYVSYWSMWKDLTSATLLDRTLKIKETCNVQMYFSSCENFFKLNGKATSIVIHKEKIKNERWEPLCTYFDVQHRDMPRISVSIIICLREQKSKIFKN